MPTTRSVFVLLALPLSEALVATPFARSYDASARRVAASPQLLFGGGGKEGEGGGLNMMETIKKAQQVRDASARLLRLPVRSRRCSTQMAERSRRLLFCASAGGREGQGAAGGADQHRD